MVWSNYSTLSAESCACYSFVFCRFGAISRPCQWSPAIAISLYFAGLEQLFNPVTAVQWLLFACMLQVWSYYSKLSVGSGVCYFLVFCRSRAMCWTCQWSPVTVISLYFEGLEQLFDPVCGVRWLFSACILQVWNKYWTLTFLCGLVRTCVDLFLGGLAPSRAYSALSVFFFCA